jgi:hypothetical protein
VDGQEYLGLVGEEAGLNLGGEHEVAVALALRGERGEDAAANAEVGRAHVGALFCAFEAEGDAAEVVCGHGNYSATANARRREGGRA